MRRWPSYLFARDRNVSLYFLLMFSGVLAETMSAFLCQLGLCFRVPPCLEGKESMSLKDVEGEKTPCHRGWGQAGWQVNGEICTLTSPSPPFMNRNACFERDRAEVHCFLNQDIGWKFQMLLMNIPSDKKY